MASCLQLGELPLLQPIISLIACISIRVGQECVVLEPYPVWLSVQLKRSFCFSGLNVLNTGYLSASVATGEQLIHVCISQL